MEQHTELSDVSEHQKNHLRAQSRNRVDRFLQMVSP